MWKVYFPLNILLTGIRLDILSLDTLIGNAMGSHSLLQTQHRRFWEGSDESHHSSSVFGGIETPI